MDREMAVFLWEAGEASPTVVRGAVAEAVGPRVLETPEVHSM